MNETLLNLWDKLVTVSWELLVASLFFILLSLILKREGALEAGRKSLSETRLNLVYYFTDLFGVTPFLVVLTSLTQDFLIDNGLTLLVPGDYTFPVLVTALLAVFVSDLVGYWRHRLMHTAWLWPAHAVHHSDRQLTWLGLMRFHPVNRVITVGLDILVLTLLGFPAWTIVLNALIRHFYGFFIHADLPFTYGPLRFLFVSPRLHRWHHLRDAKGAGSNFATVFSVFDLAFKTFYLPKKEIGELGVNEPDFPSSWLGQTLYPFRVWGRALIR